MNNAEVAHLWAHRARASAKGSSFHFSGDSIYSYGMEIARHVVRNGRPAVLFTRAGYSSTTSTHKGIVRDAIPERIIFEYADHRLPVFYVDELTSKKPNRLAYLRAYEREIRRSIDATTRARKYRAQHIEDALANYNAAVAMADFFGWKYSPPQDLAAQAELWPQEIATERARMEEEQRRLNIENEMAAADEIRRFIEGDPAARVPHYVKTAFARIEGKELVTSKGARVLVRAARRVMPFILGKIKDGEAWARNGETLKVPPYQIDEISNAGEVKAGCHTFKRDEVERIAKLLKA